MTTNPETLNELALFAGAGGGILGGILCGFRTVCAVEWDAYARDVLVARQNDGCLETFPIWDDVQTFDGRPWRGVVDVVSGGFPCQDISAAGKGAGIEGERSGMWKHMARIVGEVQPRFVLVENSPLLVGRGLGLVLGDLAEMGYDAQWGVVGAHHASAPHKRDRIWIVANRAEHGRREGWAGRSNPGDTRKRKQPLQAVADAESTRLEGHRSDARQPQISEPREDGASTGMADTACEREHGKPGDAGREGSPWNEGEQESDCGGRWWATEPDVGRVAHGVAARMDRLRCLGNGQVSGVVPMSWKLLQPQDSLSKSNVESIHPETKP